MVWQDIVITLANLVLGYALVPQVYQGFKNKKGYLNLQTATLSSLGLYVMTFAFFTLKLYLSASVTLVIAILWTILFFQKLIYK